MLTQAIIRSIQVFVRKFVVSLLEEKREDGKAAGEVEGGGIRDIAVSAEDNDGTLEGSPGEDPPQGLGELDQRHSPRHSCPRNLLVCSALPGAGETRAQVLNHQSLEAIFALLNLPEWSVFSETLYFALINVLIL
ncbi:Cytochrome b-c1 complex subunit 8-2 [Hirschfeldia incana]|nr:Cytochrome b-c1 complex subunit 8-2 [Hirschfeldia incana]